MEVNAETGQNTTAAENAKQTSMEVVQLDLDRSVASMLGKRVDLAVIVETYHRHLKQYANQRPHMQLLEKRLRVDECIVYRDFVNQHTGHGNKMNNLVLVCLFRTTENGHLQVLKLNHFCGNKVGKSCDVFYVADVFQFQLSPGDEHHGGF